MRGYNLGYPESNMECYVPDMDIFETIHRHRSIRKSKPDPVTEEALEDLLAAGIRASSSGYMPVYSIIVTCERAIREKLFIPHGRQSMVLDTPSY